MSTFKDKLYELGGSPVGGGTLLSQGDSYFVDPKNGSDSNTGKGITKAVKSLAIGYDKLTANQNDVLYYVAGDVSDHITTTLTWSKSYTHLVGVAAPTNMAQRARIFNTAAKLPTPMINITGTGCSFRNMYFFHGVDDASGLIDVQVTGGRNYFENIHFAGIGHATQDAAGACCLKLNDAEENLFVGCTIGLDTQTTRTTNSSELLVDGSSRRNTFKDCLFLSYISAAAHPMVRINDATAMDRFMLFKNCLFLSQSTDQDTDMTEAFDYVAGATYVTSNIILQNCALAGIGVWSSTTANGGTKLWVDMQTVTASAVGGRMTSL